MALPTAEEFKARFPRFSAVGDTTVNLYLAEAGRTVSEDCWRAEDYADGVMYLSAHLMVEEGAVNPTGPSAGTSGAIKKAKAGAVEVEFQSQNMGGDTSRLWATYGTTIYGKRYVELLSRQGNGGQPAVLVV